MKIEHELSRTVIEMNGNAEDTLIILKNGEGVRMTEKAGRIQREEGRVLGVIFWPKLPHRPTPEKQP